MALPLLRAECTSDAATAVLEASTGGCRAITGNGRTAVSAVPPRTYLQRANSA